VFSHDGPTLVFTTPEWTLVSPFAHDKGTQPQGVLIVGTYVYKFKPQKTKVRAHEQVRLVRQRAIVASCWHAFARLCFFGTSSGLVHTVPSFPHQ
jgi:hypothetical protein